MSDCEILKFNVFMAWIAAGVMTKLVAARGQQARWEGNENEALKQNENEALKQLTILHLHGWETNLFRPTAKKLLRHLPGKLARVVASACLSTATPSYLHGSLLVAASEMLSNCTETLSIHAETFQSISAWFRIIQDLRETNLFNILSKEHFNTLTKMAAEHEIKQHQLHGVTTRFCTFCPLLLMTGLASLVELQFSENPDMVDEFFDWVENCGTSLPKYVFPNISKQNGTLLGLCHFTQEEIQHFLPQNKPVQVHKIFMLSMLKLETSSFSGMFSSPRYEDNSQRNIFQRLMVPKAMEYLSQVRNCEKQIRCYQKKCRKSAKPYIPTDRFLKLQDSFYIFGGYYSYVFARERSASAGNYFRQALREII